MNILLTGGSSGIGMATAKILISQGHRVYEISRRQFDMEGLVHFSVDITEENEVKETIRRIDELSGGLDVCIHCAGFGISGSVEHTDSSALKKQFDVNFYGMVYVNQAVIPLMRERGQGRIINISSVAAMAPIPFQAFYSASKAAINNYSMALRNELKPFGISVTAIMPGDIATGFTQAREKSLEGNEIYKGRIQKSVSGMERDEQNGMSPEEAGRFIAQVALKRSVKPLYAIGLQYKAICCLLKFLPAGFSNWLIRLLYT